MTKHLFSIFPLFIFAYFLLVEESWAGKQILSHLLDNEKNQSSTIYYFYLNAPMVTQKITEFGAQRSLPTSDILNLNPDNTLLISQHEAGFSYSRAERTVLYTDNIVDCIAGTMWNPHTKTGCLFHYDRYCTPGSVDNALLSIADSHSHQDIEITLTSSYLTPHFFALKKHLLALGYIIKHYDFYNAFHDYRPKSHLIGNKKKGFKIDAFHVHYDESQWLLDIDQSTLRKIDALSCYGYPRRVALDVTTGKISHNAFIAESSLSWQRNSRKTWWTKWLLESRSCKLNYVNEHRL